MGRDGMEAIDLGREVTGQTDAITTRRCHAAGCACMDARFLSPRRARFHAWLARTRHETADRVIAPDPEWPRPA